MSSTQGASQSFGAELRNLIKNPSFLGKFIRLNINRIKGALQWRKYQDDPGQIVAQGYDQMAGDYGSWTLRHERPDRGKYTSLLLEKLPANSEVLELGCGPGEPTTRTLAEHFKVTANDISESCLKLAKKNAPSATFVHSDMVALEFPAQSFDAVVAYYAFHHVPRQHYSTLLQNISNWLRPGGIFMAAMYPYDVENLVTEDWHGSTMYWSSFGEEKTLSLIKDCGLNVLDKQTESATEEGKETTFLWVIASKSD